MAEAGLRDSGENGGGGGGPRPGVSENNEGLNENNPIAIQFRGLFVNIRGNMPIQIKIRGLFEKSRIAIIGRDPNKGVFCKCFGPAHGSRPRGGAPPGLCSLRRSACPAVDLIIITRAACGTSSSAGVPAAAPVAPSSGERKAAVGRETPRSPPIGEK